ncbi:hypothetical protein [Streptomyces sp. NPDC029041]|uniref:hypothetical protein n=1 Tax=Streptomyces sp. NPDC029041 TaxID=3155727 RepID=UPI0033E81D55
MSEALVDLGTVNAPSGVLVLGIAGRIDQWRVAGDAALLEAWTGMDDEPHDGLTDVFSWGLYAVGRTHCLARPPPCAGLMVSVDKHTDLHRFRRAEWHHPLHVGAIDVGPCQVLGIEWDQGDHSMRHRGERAAGQVHPVIVHLNAPLTHCLCMS